MDVDVGESAGGGADGEVGEWAWAIEDAGE